MANKLQIKKDFFSWFRSNDQQCLITDSVDDADDAVDDDHIVALLVQANLTGPVTYLITHDGETVYVEKNLPKAINRYCRISKRYDAVNLLYTQLFNHIKTNMWVSVYKLMHEDEILELNARCNFNEFDNTVDGLSIEIRSNGNCNYYRHIDKALNAWCDLLTERKL